MGIADAHTPVLEKISRLRQGKRPRVLDLFAGCGGLSLGFDAAGFEIAAAVEFDPLAAQSHGVNFHPFDERHAKAYDITSKRGGELAVRRRSATMVNVRALFTMTESRQAL